MILSGRPGVGVSVCDAAATDERGRSDVDDDDIVVLRVAVAPTPRTRVLIAAFILSRIPVLCCYAEIF